MKDKFVTKTKGGEMKNPVNEIEKQPVIFFILCYAFVQDHEFKGKEQPNIANNTEDHSATSAKDSENSKDPLEYHRIICQANVLYPTMILYVADTNQSY